MAKIESYNDGEIINLTASVGKGAVNLKQDVLIVQAMLKYALKGRAFFSGLEFCEPTGSMNDATNAVIERYQKFLKRVSKIDLRVDGVIDRAVGKKPHGRNGLWTILYLNWHLVEARLLKGSPELSEFQDLAREYPVVHSVLDNLPVGSLKLTLEPSVQRVGTLNLALE